MRSPTYILSEATKGKLYKITEINTDQAMRERLRALGVIEGTEITLKEKNGKKGISSYTVRGAQIAFRYDTAKRIHVSEQTANTKESAVSLKEDSV